MLTILFLNFMPIKLFDLIWFDLLNLMEYFDEIWHTQSSPGDCKISFSIGRGFAEVYIVKKWKLPITLELDRVMMVGRVINLGRVKKGKYQEMHSWLVVWERRYRAVQFSVSWFTCSVFTFVQYNKYISSNE